LTKGICKKLERKSIERERHFDHSRKINLKDLQSNLTEKCIEFEAISNKQDWEQEADDLLNWSKELPTETNLE
jgi:hypothetical protein